MNLFDKQFKILLEDIKILVIKFDNKEALSKVNYALKQYALKNLLPDDHIVKSFYTYIKIPYGDIIMKKDESFIINLNDTGLISEDFEKDNNQSIIFLTSVFKDIWFHIDESTKDKIFTRMQILVKLCDKWKNEN